MKIEEKIRNTITAYIADEKTWENVNTIDGWYNISDSICKCLNKYMKSGFITSVLENLSIMFKSIVSKKKYLIVDDSYFDVMQNHYPGVSKMFETDKILKVFCIIAEENLVVRILYENHVYDLFETEDDDGGLIFRYIPALLTDDPEDLGKNRYNYYHYCDYTEYEESSDE